MIILLFEGESMLILRSIGIFFNDFENRKLRAGQLNILGSYSVKLRLFFNNKNEGTR